LAGALINVQAIPLDGRVQTVQLKGRVPAAAKTAHVGIRVNIEGIDEPGPANITIYRASYTQGGGRNRVSNSRIRPNTNHWGLHEDGITIRRSDIGPGLMIRIRDTAKMRTVINTGGFVVTPGASYKATMVLKVTQSTVGHAYFTVTWLSDVTEIARERLDLRPTPFRVPDRKTRSEGRYTARFADLLPGRYRIVVHYRGDATHLAAEVSTVIRVR
jgi:hypothetical protein